MIPHKTIIETLQKKIKCDKFLTIILKLLNAGFKIENSESVTKSDLGTPQGSVVSPLLANIVLHEFDDFVINDIMPNYVKGLRRKTNPEYNKLIAVRYNRGTGVINSPESRNALKMMRSTPRMLINDPDFRRSMYIRYADDFVYLFEGPKSEALEIRELLEKGLKERCELDLNKDKTIVSNISESFNFLGATIKKVPHIDSFLLPTKTKAGKTIKQRRAIRLRMNIPMEKLIDRLVINKFVRRSANKSIFATPNNVCIPLDHSRIVQFYNSKWNGLSNFYSFASNRSSL